MTGRVHGAGCNGLQIAALQPAALKAVISACHIKPTFLDLIGPQNLDSGFLQRIKDLSLKALSVNAPYSDNTTGTAIRWLGR